MRNLCALAVLRLAAAAIVQPMIAPATVDGPTTLEAVPLLTVAPSTERSLVVKKASRELLRSLGYVGEPEVEVKEQEDDDLDEQSTEDDYYDEPTPGPTTTSVAPMKITRRQGLATNTSPAENRTKLYPVGRLWNWASRSQRRSDEPAESADASTERTETTMERADGHLERTLPPRPMGMMALLDAAFSCLWSGLGFECLSLKVVPMFRAMMGFPPVQPFGHPYYVLPRTTDADVRTSQEEDGEEDEDGEDDGAGSQTGRRRRRHHFGLKMVKMGLMGLAALKTFLVPAISVLSIASGKAIVFSLAAVVLSLAAGWSAAKSADRRVYDHETPPYYM